MVCTPVSFLSTRGSPGVHDTPRRARPQEPLAPSCPSRFPHGLLLTCDIEGHEASISTYASARSAASSHWRPDCDRRTSRVREIERRNIRGGTRCQPTNCRIVPVECFLPP